MDSTIENMVIEYLRNQCPIRKIRDKKDGKKRFIKTLVILNGVLDDSIKHYAFEKDNRHNLIMIGLIIAVIDLVFSLPQVDSNVIALKYLGF